MPEPKREATVAERRGSWVRRVWSQIALAPDMPGADPVNPRQVAAVWAGLYLLLTLAWVGATDAALAHGLEGAVAPGLWQTVKGAVYAVLSALVLFLALRAALQRLAAGERRWLHMMRKLDDVAWISDVAGQLQFVNQAVRRVYGREPADFVRHRGLWLELVHPDDQARVRASHQALLAGTARDLEYRILRPDGSLRWLRDRAAAILGPTGTIVGLAGIAEDVTEQRRAREAEREQRMRLEGIVASAMEAIITVDVTQTVRLFNQTAGDIFGVAPQDAIGQPLDRFIPLPQRERHRSLVQGYARGTQSTRRMGRVDDLTGLRANGESFPIEASLSRSGEGDNLLMTVVLRDLTEQRAVERLRHAQLAAEADSRAKSTFLANMSHELRTPLSAVVGLSRLLLANTAQPLSDSQRTSVEHIRTAGGHLHALINDVLDLSAIEAGGLQVLPGVLDLVAVLHDAVALCVTLAERHGVDLHPLPAGSTPVWVQGDVVRVRQVLINLLSNAIKYNRPGGTVHLRLARTTPDVELEIEDSGLGMTNDQLAHLFEPFNRLGRDAGNVEGTGIGLVLTRKLVESMQGSLSYRSTVGQGTRVTLTWRQAEPAARLADGPGRAGAPHADPALGGTPSGLVLVIDDDPVNAAVVEGLLSDWPEVAFEAAASGGQGIEKVRQLQPRLVLLDMRLPDMDGVAVLTALREDARCARVPVVMLSASALPDEVARATAAGAAGYWTKPLEFDRLAEAVTRWVLGQAAQPASLSGTPPGPTTEG